MHKLSLLLVLSSFVFCGGVLGRISQKEEHISFHGPYVGFSVGKSLHKTEFRYTSPIFAKKNVVNAEGLEGGIILGYMHRFTNIYISGEGVFNFNGNVGENTFAVHQRNYASEKITAKNNIQFRTSLGYIINDTVAPKLILGWGYFKFNNELLNFMGTCKMGQNNNSSLLGGIGIDFLLPKNLLLGLEYTLTFGAKNKSINFPLTKIGSKMNNEKISITFRYLF